MPEIKIRVPEDLKREMDKAEGVDWSKVARDAIRKKSSQLALLKSIASKSELSKEDTIELGREVKKKLHHRYKENYPELK